jgi:hypothetical protein
MLIIVVAVVMIGGLIWVGRTLFDGGDAKPDEVNAGQKLLDKPADNMAVRMSVRGEIVASENHYSVVITISNSAREIVTFRGYDGSIIKREQLDNSPAAFNDLVAALNRAGYMKETKMDDNQNQGICAVGQLIYFEVLEYVKDDNGSLTEKTAKRLWTTSCPKLTGDFAGLVVNVEDLFVKQIPNARQIIDHAKNTVYRESYDTGLGSIE